MILHFPHESDDPAGRLSATSYPGLIPEKQRLYESEITITGAVGPRAVTIRDALKCASHAHTAQCATWRGVEPWLTIPFFARAA